MAKTVKNKSAEIIYAEIPKSKAEAEIIESAKEKDHARHQDDEKLKFAKRLLFYLVILIGLNIVLLVLFDKNDATTALRETRNFVQTTITFVLSWVFATKTSK